MKLPRWLLVTLLTTSLLALLSAGTWWWVTWPERTAREFMSMLAAGEYEELVEKFGGAAYYSYQEPSRIAWYLWQWEGSAGRLERGSRGIQDVILGRQTFRYGELGHQGGIEFQMGKVVYMWFPTY
jgi:hypothetical protein